MTILLIAISIILCFIFLVCALVWVLQDQDDKTVKKQKFLMDRIIDGKNKDFWLKKLESLNRGIILNKTRKDYWYEKINVYRYDEKTNSFYIEENLRL